MKHVKLFEQFTANEAYVGPFVFDDRMSDEELKAMYNDALSGYANWQKGFEYPKSDYKKVYQEIQKILKKRGVSVDESIINELRLTSYGVKNLLKAINNRLDLLPQLGFDKFKDVIHHLKYGDQEEQKELQDKLKELGVNVAYESLEVNEAKVIDRDEMIKWIQQYMKLVKTTEEFDGSAGGIWVSGENMDLFKGKRIYDYYNETRAYDLGVLSSWEKELDKRGWYSEWYDAGTVMIWQN